MIRRILTSIGALLALLCLTTTYSVADLASDYTFFATTGTPSDMAGASSIWQGSSGNRRAGMTQTIDFKFSYLGTDYDQVTVSSSGALALGGSFYSNTYNDLSGYSGEPTIAPFWDYLYVSGGAGKCSTPEVSFLVKGQSPNQILIVKYHDIELANYVDGSWGNFEIRLYQLSGKIEFYYDNMSPCDVCNRGRGCGSTSASIGLTDGYGSFLSVTPSGGSATVDASKPNDYIDLNNGDNISDGTLYTFVPCQFKPVGLVGPAFGGTANLDDGDTFFQGFFVETGTSRTFTPFIAAMSNAACSGDYTLDIVGSYASDYYFDGVPGNTSVSRTVSNGLIDSVGITFEPSGSGVRDAILIMTGPAGYYRTFNLAAAAPRINYIPDIAEGGTSRMKSGDTLMANIRVTRRSSGTFTPFTLLNIGSEGGVNVTYTLFDPSGQYTINPAATVLTSDETNTPGITFSPTGVGHQPALLTVNTEDEVRTFVLYAYSVAPGGAFLIGGTVIDSNSAVFSNQFTCSGEGLAYYPIQVRNIGDNDFVINDLVVYLTDTMYQQGTPHYPLLRDPQTDELVPTNEYVITEQVPVAPTTANPKVNFPVVIPEKGSRTLYISFVAGRPGKRFARVFINTNGENFTNTDPFGEPIVGLAKFDLFGRGIGGVLTDNPNGGVPKPVVFPTTAIGESSDAWLHLQNPGNCDLRIAEGDLLRIFAGDVEEFSVVSIPSSWSRDGVTGDLKLAPGAGDSIQLRFTPRHIGSRRATLWMRTNDSTVIIPGQSERGTYYLDLYGVGGSGLYASSLDLGAVLLGGTVTSTGTVKLRNASDGPMIVQTVAIGGTDAADFTEDPASPWPSQPLAVMPGQSMDFSVVFNPTGTQAGPRTASLWFVTDIGDTVTAMLTGEAGTRTVAVNPAVMNFGNLSVGMASRRTIMIANTGTMPLHLQAPVLGGTNPGDYSLGAFPRLDIAPGGVEYLEVTYRPTSKGPSNATLTIGSDAPGGAVVVQLGGTGVKAKLIGDDPTGSSAEGGKDGLVPGSGNPQGSISGIVEEAVPNPVHGDGVEISYRLERAGTIRLALYDVQGRLVRLFEEGDRAVGAYRVQVDVKDVPTGVYFYGLTVDGATTSRTLRIVK